MHIHTFIGLSDRKCLKEATIQHVHGSVSTARSYEYLSLPTKIKYVRTADPDLKA